MSAKEKIAWLKGLLSVLEIEGKNAKVLLAFIETLDALTKQIEEQNEQIEFLRNLYNELEEECALLGDEILMLEDILDEYVNKMIEEDEKRTVRYISVTCPSCTYVFYCEQTDNKDENEALECPDCGKVFFVNTSFINDDDQLEYIDGAVKINPKC